jgi:hypothetical protein
MRMALILLLTSKVPVFHLRTKTELVYKTLCSFRMLEMDKLEEYINSKFHEL